jgi:hypothetical protein
MKFVTIHTQILDTLYKNLWSVILNILKHLLRDFYIIICFTQLRNIMNSMKIKSCKSYYMGCELNLYHAIQQLKTVYVQP